MYVQVGILSVNPSLFIHPTPPPIGIVMITEDGFQMKTEDEQLMITEDT